jgi:peptidoglycan/LPS O-acetylase OafA/YrhL
MRMHCGVLAKERVWLQWQFECDPQRWQVLLQRHQAPSTGHLAWDARGTIDASWLAGRRVALIPPTLWPNSALDDFPTIEVVRLRPEKWLRFDTLLTNISCTNTHSCRNNTTQPAGIQMRNEFIHMLRGLAALAVVCFHIYGHSRDHSSTALVGIRQFSEYGYLGVPVFFVISGFVIANSLRGARFSLRYAGLYAARRELRLAPPYWATIGLAVGLNLGLAIVLGEQMVLPSGGQLFSHAFYLQEMTGYGSLSMGLWTLCLEVQFYLLMLLLLAASQKLRVPVVAFVVSLGGISLLFNMHALPEDQRAAWASAWRCLLPNFSMFAIGILAWLLYARQISLRLWLAAQAVVAARLGWWFQPELLAAWLTGIAISLNAIGRMPLPVIRPLMFLGTISYSLYLVHAPAARIFVLGAAGSEGYASALTCTIAIGFAIFASWLAYLCIERPSITLSQRLKPQQESAVKPVRRKRKILREDAVAAT